MRKEAKYKLHYFTKEGEEKEIELKIKFVSNQMLQKYGEVVQAASIAENAWDRISDLASLIAEENELKEDGYKERIEEYKEEMKRCSEDISAFNNNSFFEDRFNLVKLILERNGYGDNEMLMDYNFWDECVNPGDIVEFLATVAYKDVDFKKKAV